MAAIPADPWVAPSVLAIYALLLVPFHLVRAARWWFLLRRLGDVPLREAIALGMVGYMWIALLPLRLGELARPLLVAHRHAITIAARSRSSRSRRVTAVSSSSRCSSFPSPATAATMLGSAVAIGAT